jgi:hypothetical protein
MSAPAPCPAVAAGGPLEVSKRRLVTPLLYCEVGLWVLAFVFSLFCTAMLLNPAVQSTCFTDNPCAYYSLDQCVASADPTRECLEGRGKGWLNCAKQAS